MPSSEHPPENLLLSALSRRDRKAFLADCESIDLPAASFLCQKGDRIRHVYFPTGSFISLVAPGNGAGNLEVAMVGNEGMVGTSLLLDVDIEPLQALVQGAGPCLRMSAGNFKRHLGQSRPLLKRLQRYLYVATCQLSQAASCNHYHVVEDRLARLLLMTEDRAHSPTFHITQELLARLLGVRRVGVTKAAGSLQRRQLITYRRGTVSVVDRPGLEAASCRCYAADQTTYRNLLDQRDDRSREQAERVRGGKRPAWARAPKQKEYAGRRGPVHPRPAAHEP